MFATHPTLKSSIQLDHVWTSWRAVEATVHWSMYIVTFKDGHEADDRTFFVGGTNDLLDFISRTPFGKIVAMTLLVSPSFSESLNWEAISIAFVDKVQPTDDHLPLALLTAEDGRLFGGYPTMLLHEFPQGTSTRIAELSARA